MRLQKYISLCGIASRREAEKLIAQGFFSVNGEKAIIGNNVLENDIVTFKGKQIKPQKYVYYKLNKPVGYITSVKDQFGRKTVLDIMPKEIAIFPVGRLDYNTSGILILTNDGDLANNLMHPSLEKPKTYLVQTSNILEDKKLKQIEKGVFIDGYKTMPAKITVCGKAEFELTIKEGKNRQVRKMIEAVGSSVVKLHRKSISGIDVSDLKTGEFKHLTKEELERLRV
ncbi:MAG: rRNA pseudouridine synthase [Defluviitaleaceae bacterium]|nr:rRNA pseudouridine synthase [Defluviitaleaceae bacterium]